MKRNLLTAMPRLPPLDAPTEAEIAASGNILRLPECGHCKTLDAVADAVLAHKPKPKSKPARKRARRAKKLAQGTEYQR